MIRADLVGDKALIARLGATSAKVMKRLGLAMRKLQYDLVQAARDENRAVLHQRTGNLIGSILPGTFDQSDTKIEATVVAGGGENFYARIQEYGGTIVPKNVSFLTIPLDAAKTASGVGRWSAREIIEDPSIGGYSGTFFKHGVLFGKTPDGITPLFALKSSVTLPSRPYMRPALLKMRPQIETELAAAIAEGLQE